MDKNGFNFQKKVSAIKIAFIYRLRGGDKHGEN
jgi:hypothetical protein